MCVRLRHARGDTTSASSKPSPDNPSALVSAVTAALTAPARCSAGRSAAPPRIRTLACTAPLLPRGIYLSTATGRQDGPPCAALAGSRGEGRALWHGGRRLRNRWRGQTGGHAGVPAPLCCARTSSAQGSGSRQPASMPQIPGYFESVETGPHSIHPKMPQSRDSGGRASRVQASTGRGPAGARPGALGRPQPSSAKRDGKKGNQAERAQGAEHAPWLRPDARFLEGGTEGQSSDQRVGLRARGGGPQAGWARAAGTSQEARAGWRCSTRPRGPLAWAALKKEGKRPGPPKGKRGAPLSRYGFSSDAISSSWPARARVCAKVEKAVALPVACSSAPLGRRWGGGGRWPVLLRCVVARACWVRSWRPRQRAARARRGGAQRGGHC
jgi:hypothetical protein